MITPNWDSVLTTHSRLLSGSQTCFHVLLKGLVALRLRHALRNSFVTKWKNFQVGSGSRV